MIIAFVAAFVLLLALLSPSVASAQISVPNTFVANTTAYAAEVNQNFSQLASDALNRGGGTITGNIAVDSGITIDGVDVGLGIPATVSTKTSNYTVLTTDGIRAIFLANGTFTITLYASSGMTGRMVTVKNIGTGAVTIDGNASETIDGSATQVISAAQQSLTLVSDGTNWQLV